MLRVHHLLKSFRFVSFTKFLILMLPLLTAAFASLMFQPLGIARAATITVNTSDDTGADDGLCSLREAIEAANNDTTASTGDCAKGSGTDVISFVSGLTITLGSELPAVTTNIEFIGSAVDPNGTIVDGAASFRSGFEITTADVKLVNMRFQNGNSAGHGGAIFQSGSGELTIQHSEFGENISAGSGGAIYLTSTPSIEFQDSFFTFNTASGDGGAIYVDSGLDKINLANNHFQDNFVLGNGGAIYVNGSIPGGIKFEGPGGGFDANHADFDGGLIYVAGDVNDIKVQGILLSNNNADRGGAFMIEGILTGTVKIEAVSVLGNHASVQSGGVLDAPNVGSLFTVKISDSNVTSNNAATFGGVLATNGTLTSLKVAASDVEVNSAADGGAFYAAILGAVSIKDSELAFNQAIFGKGGVLYTPVLLESLKISNTQLGANSAVDEGGAIMVDDASTATSIKITDCFILLNHVTDGSGGVMNIGPFSGDVRVKGSFFEQNEASEDGGALVLATTGATTIKTTTFIDNEAGFAGGAVAFLGGGSLTVKESVFEQNHAADGSGGAIDAPEQVEVSIKDSTFTENTSGSNGGAVRIGLEGGSASIKDSMFDSNTTTTRGGALSINEGTSATISGSTFTNNTAGNDAGAASIRDTFTITIENSIFGGNSSGSDGGALFVSHGDGPGTLTVEQSVFGFNSSSTSGGAITADDPDTTVTMTESRVHNNSSIVGGGIFFTLGTVNKNCFEGNGVAVFDNDGGSDVTKNWWGDVSGPFNLPDNPGGTGDEYEEGSGATNFLPFLTAAPECPAAFVP